MSMNFLDETDDWPEYRIVREEIQRLEVELRELSRALEAAATSPGAVAAGGDPEAELEGIKTRLKAIREKLDASLSMYR